MSRAPRHAIVLAGGSGSRFWPRSRVRLPKQLLEIAGRSSMLQQTIARLAPLVPPERVTVVVGPTHAARVRAQLRAAGAPRLLVEPRARSTAAAVALAALRLAREAPDAVIAVLAADHVIGNAATFRADLALALDIAARSERLVTLGVTPTAPETAYGWMRTAASLPGTRGRAAEVREFVEKPDRARAERLLAEGDRVLWNAGIFAWRVSVVLDALREHAPAVIGPLEAALHSGGAAALARAYRRVPAVSIDTAVLERSPRLAVVRARFAWRDVGSWAALEAVWGDGDGRRNAVRGRAVAIDSAGCVVDSPARLVALLGVQDLVIVDTPDALLVCNKRRAQDVRLVVGELRRRRLGRYL